MTLSPKHLKDTVVDYAAYRKAIVAFVLPLVGAIGAAMQDGNLTVNEAVAAVGFALVTGGATYAVKNED